MPDQPITAFASAHKDGETWETNGFHFKREGGKTRRVSASAATPVPVRPPMPTKPRVGYTPRGLRVTLHPRPGTSPASPAPREPLPPSAPPAPPPDPAMASFKSRVHARVRRLAMEWWPKIASIPTMTPALLATAGMGALGAVTGTPGSIMLGSVGAGAMLNKAMDRGSKKAKAVRLRMAKSAAEKRRAERRNREAYFSELAALTREFITAFSEYHSFAWYPGKNGSRYWVPAGRQNTPENRKYGIEAERAAQAEAAARNETEAAAARAKRLEEMEREGTGGALPPSEPKGLGAAVTGAAVGGVVGSLAGPAGSLAGTVGGAAAGYAISKGLAALEKARDIRSRVKAAAAAGHTVGQPGGPVRRLVRRLTGFAEDGRPVYRFSWEKGKRGGRYWLPPGKPDIPANRLYGAKAEAAANAGKKAADKPGGGKGGPKPGEAERIARAKFSVARDAHAAASAPGSGVPADRVEWLKARAAKARQDLDAMMKPAPRGR